jgi:hypothetical protein
MGAKCSGKPAMPAKACTSSYCTSLTSPNLTRRIRLMLYPKDKRRSQANYEKDYFEFIKRNYHDLFSGFDCFKEARSFIWDMKKLGLWDQYSKTMNEICEFVGAGINHGQVIKCNKLVLSAFSSHSIGCHHVMLEVLKFCDPERELALCAHGFEQGHQATAQ